MSRKKWHEAGGGFLERGDIQWHGVDEALEHVPAVAVLGCLLSTGGKGLCAPGAGSVAPGPGQFWGAGVAAAVQKQGCG